MPAASAPSVITVPVLVTTAWPLPLPPAGALPSSYAPTQM